MHFIPLDQHDWLINNNDVLIVIFQEIGVNNTITLCEMRMNCWPPFSMTYNFVNATVVPLLTVVWKRLNEMLQFEKSVKLFWFLSLVYELARTLRFFRSMWASLEGFLQINVLASVISFLGLVSWVSLRFGLGLSPGFSKTQREFCILPFRVPSCMLNSCPHPIFWFSSVPSAFSEFRVFNSC